MQSLEHPLRNGHLEDDDPKGNENLEGLTAADLAISATARSLVRLDPVLDELARRTAGAPPRALLDLGCGMGALTMLVGRRLGITELFGVDQNPLRLDEAARRGIRTFALDLERDRIPLPDASVGLVTCFGVLGYLTLYDHCLTEAGRVLEDGGWLLISAPNLAGWVSRISLLLGFQPGEVQVSAQGQPGAMGRRRRSGALVGVPHLHGTTLGCLEDLLADNGFEVVTARALSPEEPRLLVRAVDSLLRGCPSLSRRILLLARRVR